MDNEEEKQEHTNACMNELTELMKTPFEENAAMVAALVASVMITCTCPHVTTKQGARRVLEMVVSQHPKAIEILLLMERFLGLKL